MSNRHAMLAPLGGRPKYGWLDARLKHLPQFLATPAPHRASRKRSESAQLASWADRVVFLRDGQVVDRTAPRPGPDSLLTPGVK